MGNYELTWSGLRSCLLYCSPLWRPYQIQHITLLERIQHQASKFILNDYSTDYKSRLIKLNLSLMYIYKLTDILSLLILNQSSLPVIVLISQTQSSHPFQSQTTDHSVLTSKLCHKTSINSTTLNSYFLDYLDFGILFPSLTLPFHTTQSQGNLYYFYGVFYLILIPTITVLSTFMSLL